MLRKQLVLIVVAWLILLCPFRCWSDSTRVEPVVTSYNADDILLTSQDQNHFYSSGMDVVYANGARHFLILWNTSSTMTDPPPVGNSITLSLYDGSGNLILDLATYIDPLNADGNPDNDIVMWPQSVKLDQAGETIWISYTSTESGGWPENVSDWFCTLPWDSTLAGYPQSMTPQFDLAGNWEMEWSTDPTPGQQWGKPFVSGLVGGEWYHNGIYLYKGGNNLQLVIDPGGASAGFAFDNSGNLWYASYALSPEKIYMWTAGQINTAVTDELLLTLGDATVEISSPNSLGGDDVEADGAGNLYFSFNGGTTGYGQLVRVDNNGSPPWPDSATVLGQTIAAYDWQRTLAFDGSGDLSEGSSRLYLDMDQGLKGSTPPTIVEVFATPHPEPVPGISPRAFLLGIGLLAVLGITYDRRPLHNKVK